MRARALGPVYEAYRRNGRCRWADPHPLPRSRPAPRPGSPPARPTPGNILPYCEMERRMSRRSSPVGVCTGSSPGMSSAIAKPMARGTRRDLVLDGAEGILRAAAHTLAALPAQRFAAVPVSGVCTPCAHGCPDHRAPAIRGRNPGLQPEAGDFGDRARKRKRGVPHTGIRSCAMVPARLHTPASPHTGFHVYRHSDASAHGHLCVRTHQRLRGGPHSWPSMCLRACVSWHFHTQPHGHPCVQVHMCPGTWLHSHTAASGWHEAVPAPHPRHPCVHVPVRLGVQLCSRSRDTRTATIPECCFEPGRGMGPHSGPTKPVRPDGRDRCRVWTECDDDPEDAMADNRPGQPTPAELNRGNPNHDSFRQTRGFKKRSKDM